MVALNCTHWDPIFNSVIPDRDRKKWEGRVAGYRLAKSLLTDHMNKPENMKYGCYVALLDTCVEWIATAMRLEKPYTQKLLMNKPGGRFLITTKDYQAQTGHSDFEHRREKSGMFRDCE